jgi:hypothetical protein
VPCDHADDENTGGSAKDYGAMLAWDDSADGHGNSCVLRHETMARALLASQ